jgi:hypothetical protein
MNNRRKTRWIETGFGRDKYIENVDGVSDQRRDALPYLANFR